MAVSLAMSVFTGSLSLPNFWNVDNNLTAVKVIKKNEGVHEVSDICNLLYYSYLWEILLFWEIFLPIMGLICFFKSSRSEPLSWVWLYSVLHANISVWIWISYFTFTYNYCWQQIANLECPNCSTVACTGGIFLGISLVVSIIASIANDQYYPDSRLTAREAVRFFTHLKESTPVMTILLRTHVNSRGDWKKVKRVFKPGAWYDHTVYPNVAEILNNEKAAIFKVQLSVSAQTVEAKDELRMFVWEFSQEHDFPVTLEDTDEYHVSTAIYPPVLNNSRFPTALIRHPTITTDNVMCIYVRKNGHMPRALDFLLKFSWILNLFGLSGIVLYHMSKLQEITEKVLIEKHYGANTAVNRQISNFVAEPSSEFSSSDSNRMDLPPRYASVVDIEKAHEEENDLPTYDQAIKLICE